MVKINYVVAMEQLIVVERPVGMDIDWENPLRGTRITERQAERANIILLRVSPSEFWVAKNRYCNRYHKTFVNACIANDIIEHHISQYYEIFEDDA